MIGGAEHVQEYTCHREGLDSTPKIDHLSEAVEMGLDFFWFADDALGETVSSFMRVFQAFDQGNEVL